MTTADAPPPVHALSRKALLRLALLGFAAMFANDVLGTSMVVMEAHYDAIAAGVFDDLQWLTGLVCAALAVGEILRSGWRSPKSLVIIVSISAANFAGTVAGVHIARALT